MRNYLTLFRLLFSYMFKKSDQKSSRWLWLAYAVIALAYGVIVFTICASIYQIAPTFAQMDLLAELLTLILAVGCVAVVVFGLIPTLNYLYFSKDTEFMLTLPVKPSTVFMAKLSVVYLTEIVVSTVMLLPCMITVGIALSLSPIYYIVSVIAILLVPSIPLVLVTIIAIPLMYIVSFFKNKGALTSIVLILLFGVVFGAYYLVLGQLSYSEGDIVIDPELIVQSFIGAINSVATILFPLTAIARVSVLSPKTLFGVFPVPLAVLINSALFLLSCALLFALAVLISGAVYRKSVSSMLEGNGKREGKSAEYKESKSPFSALLKKEWRELFRTPAFAFQCLAGIVLVPIIIAFMASSLNMEILLEDMGEITPEMLDIASLLVSFVMIAFICMMGVSLNVGASTAITREGKNFFVMKTMPVPYKTQIKAKLALYLIISTLTILLSMIITAFTAFHAVNLICGAVFLLIYNYGFNCFCLFMDAHRPKLDWVTHNEAVKNNKNSAVPMLINMAITVVLCLIPILFFVLIPIEPVALALSWIVLIAIAVAVAVVFHSLLYANIDRFINRIEL